MGLWHVFYESWQMECCGTPFGVGDEVSWPLLLQSSEDILDGGWHDQLTKVTGPLDVESGRDGPVRLLRDENGLVVPLPDEGGSGPGPGDRVRLVGMLTVETHGAVLPETRGRVRAVQVVSQGFAQSPPGDGAWRPVAKERSIRAVDRCPKWFADRETGAGPDGRPRRRVDAGALVTLEVPDTDSWLSYAVREASGLPKDAPPGAETQDIDGTSLAALLETFSTVRGRSS
jgi:hypothetical protein